MIRKLLIALALLVADGSAGRMARGDLAQFRSSTAKGASRTRATSRPSSSASTSCCAPFTASQRRRPPIALRVFLLSSGGAVARMAGAPGSGVAGYYVPDARAQMLVGTRSRASLSAEALDPETILLHEYTHHFMYQYFPATYPTWYSEGYRGVLGRDPAPRQRRRRGRPARRAPLRDLPGPRLAAARAPAARRTIIRKRRRENVFLLYAEGWLLVRYVFEHPERQRQLDQYLQPDQPRHQPTTRRRARPSPISAGSTTSCSIMPARPATTSSACRSGPSMSARSSCARRGPAEQALMSHEIRLSQGYRAARGRGVRRATSEAIADALSRRSVRDPDGDGEPSVWPAITRRPARRPTVCSRSQPEQCPRAGDQGAGSRSPRLRVRAARPIAAAWDAARQLLPARPARRPARSARPRSHYDSYRRAGRAAARRRAERALRRARSWRRATPSCATSSPATSSSAA